MADKERNFATTNPIRGAAAAASSGPAGRRNVGSNVTLRKGQKHYQKPSLEKAMKYKVSGRRARTDDLNK